MADGNTGDVTLFGEAGIALFFDQRRGELRRFTGSVLKPFRTMPTVFRSRQAQEFKGACVKLGDAMAALEAHASSEEGRY